MNPYERLARWIGQTRFFGWLGPTVIRPYDDWVHGKRMPDSSLGLHLDVVYLTTIGRRSGEARTVPLLDVPSDHGGRVVVGTNWGGPDHPAWVTNLISHPEATLERDGESTPVSARRLPAEEFDRYWPRFLELWPPYAAYQERADREIAMFELQKREP